MPRRGNRNNRAVEAQTSLHISVDFGTTFSAAAYGTESPSQDIRDINPVTRYPGGGRLASKDVNEVPTVLAYKAGQKEPVAWGWEALWQYKKKKNTDLVLASRFKLFLSERDNTKHLRNDLRKKLLVDGRTEIDLIVDFLKPFREFILTYIQNSEEGGEEFAGWRHQWTITVPADWSPPARRTMLKAADIAGFTGRVKLISEPEAAALYILEDRAEKKRKLSLEAAAVVGDLGGGTSDSATFLVSTLDPLSLTGLATTKGVICGAGNLTDNLRRFLSFRLNDAAKQYLEVSRDLSFEQILDDAVDGFHNEIKAFPTVGDDSETEVIEVPNLREDADYGFIRSGVEISRRELRSQIFDPVVKEVLDLLRDQVTASIHSRGKLMNHSRKFRIEHIFLTGGLSANEYVYERVKEAFKEKEFVHYPIEVLRPKHPDTAVVFGAVWKSLHPEKVSVMLSETSYGFRQDESYTEGWSHGGPGPVKNSVTGMLEMKDRMKWVIKKDQKKKFGSVPYRLERYVPSGGSLEFCETMYYSDTVAQDHVYYEHPDIHYFGQIHFSLEKWRKQFTEIPRGVDGSPYMMIEYELISTIDEDYWLYEIQVLGSKTGFRDGGRITAGFKLSQGAGLE